MRTYERPLMIMKEFTANEAIAACKPNQDVKTYCLQGPNKDDSNILSSDMGCTRKAVYTPSNTVKKTGSKYGPFSNETGNGFYVVCVPLKSSTNQNAYTYGDTSQWNTSTGTHTGGTHQNWHCMAAKVTDIQTVGIS